ncbi:hypothetical protein [Sphingomonas sp. 3-13AW]|uniref:hypothetical protein n=1 Tax=Sphingomonas sp. 3-13AW TaxID=3050450 RepID=UPI003BB49D76
MDAFPKKSILTPIGALAVAVLSVTVTAAVYVRPSPLSWLLLIIGVVPLGVALWAYIYFAIRDPDRLQTEDFRIQRQYVALIGTPDGQHIITGEGARLIDNPRDRAGAVE